MSPAELHDALVDLARNLRWSWDPPTRAVLDRLPTATPGRHPVSAVQALEDHHLAALAAEPDFVDALRSRSEALATELRDAVESPEIVYYSPEYGLTEMLPQYSGGLGVLAGDHLKAASDLGLRLGAVGLFYREGFFRQEIIGHAQQEHPVVCDPVALGGIDTGQVVEVPFPGRSVHVRVWRFAVGRVPLLLLDCDDARNATADRRITDRLYSGDRQHRLDQELVLGIGGARAVAALGWSPRLHHLNEGHAGFLALELLDRERQAGTPTFAAALEHLRAQILFTTHTPVPAGIDRFDADVIGPSLAVWAERWGHQVEDLFGLGAEPEHPGPERAEDGSRAFNMAALCLRVSGRANGVSQLHGEVSRELFASFPGGDAITSVTNGVHARTWVHPDLAAVFDDHLGPGWDLGDDDAWSRVARLDGDTIRVVRRRMRSRLADELHARTGVSLHPRALVIGFARRFATYKRATLLLRHPDVLAELLADEDRPVQFVFAGKAHPADVPGKSLLAEILGFGASSVATGRFVFVPDYDMGLARAMVAGCDLWLNTPVRPHEASGTSGQKAALNGVLNCSIRDGWWAELSDGRNGWDIPSVPDDEHPDRAARDEADAAALHAVLAQIRSEYHGAAAAGGPVPRRTGPGPSDAWVERMRHAWRTLGPEVTAARMVADYDHRLYR